MRGLYSELKPDCFLLQTEHLPDAGGRCVGFRTKSIGLRETALLTSCKETHGVVKFTNPKVPACQPGISSGEPSWIMQDACLLRAR